jgi:hypothetical protein
MLLDKKYIIMILSMLMFMWRYLAYPKLKVKNVKCLDFIDALFHMLIMGLGLYIFDYKSTSKQINYMRTPAEF